MDPNGDGMADGDNPDWTYDPNEPRYCLCNQVSYGDMVACDNEDVSSYVNVFDLEHHIHWYLCTYSCLFVCSAHSSGSTMHASASLLPQKESGIVLNALRQ